MSRLLELLEQRRKLETLRDDFGTWCEHALEPVGQKPARHHRLLIKELQAVAKGENDRLMVFMPPGSAKSTYSTVLYPAWFMAQAPRLNIACVSHTASLAEKFSRHVMALVRDNEHVLGYGLERENAELWSTTNGCHYRAVGIGGPLTGFRADLAIIDDPVKDRMAADSERVRETTDDWFRSVLITRLVPGARIVLIQTRWHPGDLAGRILEREPDRWRVVSLAALADHDDPLGRAPGEPLWPEWEGTKALADKRRSVGERDWAALFQQQPRPTEGSIIKPEWWLPWTDPAPRRPDLTILSLDLAYTAKEQNDYSACTVWDVVTAIHDAEPAKVRDENFFRMQPGPEDFRSKALLRFAWAERLEFPALIEGLLETVRSYKRPSIPMRILIEAKGPGLSVIQELRRRAPSLNIWAVVPKGDKVARAHSITAMLEDGAVYAMAETKDGKTQFKPAVQGVIDECAAFPLGTHDDRADSTTQALRHIRDLGFEIHAEDSPPPVSFQPPAPLY